MGNCKSNMLAAGTDDVINPIMSINAQNVFILGCLPIYPQCWNFIDIYQEDTVCISGVELTPFGGNLAIISDHNYQPARTKGRGRTARNRRRRQKEQAAQLIAFKIQVVDEYGHLVSMPVDIKFTFNDGSIINLIWFDQETSYFEDTNGSHFMLMEQFYAVLLSSHRESKFILYRR